MATTTLSRKIGNQTLTFESGKMARLADGAVMVTYGETQVLGTCVSSNPREGIDFFPLTIDVEERMYAVGKIPGSFFRREGRPSETAVLTCRLIDRPLRPTFREGYRDEVQVVITVLGMDGENPYDIPAMNAASVATCLAGLPFDGPVASVRMGLIDGQWVVNPTFQEVEDATFDVVVAGRRNESGVIDILMIEGEAPDNTWALLASGATAPTEEKVAEGLEAAKVAINELIDFQQEFVDAVGVTEQPWEPRPLYGDDVYEAVSAFAKDRLAEAIVPDKAEREAKLDALKAETKEHLASVLGDDAAARAGEFGPAWKQLQKKVMRKRVIDEGIRLDGRSADRHPAALGRGRRAEAGARLGALQPGRHPGPEHHHARHAADDADDRHARPRGREAVHASLQLPAVLHGRDGPRRLAAPPRDRSRGARRAGARPRGPDGGGVPLRAAAGERRPLVERVHLHGLRLRLDALADGCGRADQGAGRRHRDGHDRRRQERS